MLIGTLRQLSSKLGILILFSCRIRLNFGILTSWISSWICIFGTVIFSLTFLVSIIDWRIETNFIFTSLTFSWLGALEFLSVISVVGSSTYGIVVFVTIALMSSVTSWTLSSILIS